MEFNWTTEQRMLQFQGLLNTDSYLWYNTKYLPFGSKRVEPFKIIIIKNPRKLQTFYQSIVWLVPNQYEDV